MVAQYNGGASFLSGDAVEVAATQAGAHGAIGAALGHFIDDDGIGVLVFDAVRHLHLFKEFGQDGRGEVRLPLIEVAGEDVDGQKATPFQFM